MSDLNSDLNISDILSSRAVVVELLLTTSSGAAEVQV